MTTLVSIFQALAPLHAGVGQGIGTIDLPIAREKSTNIPLVPGSSVKGVLRDRCQDDQVRTTLFGPETTNASDFAGSVYFSDLTLLCLPVRSLQKVFSWVTSPYILRRFQRDLYARESIKKLAIPKIQSSEEARVANNGILLDQKVFLEELDLTAQVTDEAKNWAAELGKLVFPAADDESWRAAFSEQFCIVHDDVFSYLMEHGTQVTARIRLEEDSKTVAKGGLWYEESLPVESLLWGLVQVDSPKGGKLDIQSEQELQALVRTPLQLGGKASVGRGFGWLKFHGVGGK